MPGALLCCPQPPLLPPQGHRWESYWCSQSAAASTILSTALLSTILYTPLLSSTARYSIHRLQSHPSDQISRSWREASLSPDHCYCSSIFCLPTYSMPQGSTEVKMGNKLDNINMQSIHMRQRKSRLFNISDRNKDFWFFSCFICWKSTDSLSVSFSLRLKRTLPNCVFTILGFFGLPFTLLVSTLCLYNQ